MLIDIQIDLRADDSVTLDLGLGIRELIDRLD
jgi:hypothetical protein